MKCFLSVYVCCSMFLPILVVIAAATAVNIPLLIYLHINYKRFAIFTFNSSVSFVFVNGFSQDGIVYCERYCVCVYTPCTRCVIFVHTRKHSNE